MAYDDLFFRIHTLERMLDNDISRIDVHATTTITLEKGGATVVFKSVPAEIGETCGERYVSEAVTARRQRETNETAGAGVEVEVRSFAA